MRSLLEVVGAHVRFPSASGVSGLLKSDTRSYVSVVADVSFSLATGETYALVGESGSGKTTLARAINGLLPLDAQSSVRFDNVELTSLSRREIRSQRRKMAMMFQDPHGSLSSRQTVRQLLKEPFQVHGMSNRDLDAECNRLLGLVGLPNYFADRYPHQLSGGQARRVGLARAVALDPKLIIADEPTAGLDVSIQGDVLNLLNTMQDRMGVAILIITHNLQVVRHIAHRVGIMYLGRLVEEGPTNEIFSAPKHPYTKALLSAGHAPASDGEKIELCGEVPSLRKRPSGCEFHTRCPLMQTKCASEIPTMEFRQGEQRYRCFYPLSPARENKKATLFSVV